VGVTVTFQSDSETTSPATGPDSLTVPETGLLQSPLISQQLQFLGALAAIINIAAQSDIDAVVPQRTTLLLVGFPLVTLNARVLWGMGAGGRNECCFPDDRGLAAVPRPVAVFHMWRQGL